MNKKLSQLFDVPDSAVKMIGKQLIASVLIFHFLTVVITKKFVHERERRDVFTSDRLQDSRKSRSRRSLAGESHFVRRSVLADDPDSVNTNPSEGKCRNPVEEDPNKQIFSYYVSSKASQYVFVS